MSAGDPNYRGDAVDPTDDYAVGWGWWWWIILWIILIIIFFGGGWWWGGWWGNRYGNGYNGNQTNNSGNNGGQENLTQGSLTWEDVVGRPVTTPGTVAQTFANLPRVFTLTSPEPGGHPLLVIMAKQANPAATTFKQGEKLVVTGTLHRFARQDVSQQTGLNLPTNEFESWAGRLYILATRATPATGNGTAPSPSP